MSLSTLRRVYLHIIHPKTVLEPHFELFGAKRVCGIEFHTFPYNDFPPSDLKAD